MDALFSNLDTKLIHSAKDHDVQPIDANENISVLINKCCFFYILYRETADTMYKSYIGKVLDVIYEKAVSGLPFSFKDGILGVGWLVDFLIQNNFIDPENDDILDDLDFYARKFLLQNYPRIDRINELGIYFIQRFLSDKTSDKIKKQTKHNILMYLHLLNQQAIKNQMLFSDCINDLSQVFYPNNAIFTCLNILIRCSLNHIFTFRSNNIICLVLSAFHNKIDNLEKNNKRLLSFLLDELKTIEFWQENLIFNQVMQNINCEDTKVIVKEKKAMLYPFIFMLDSKKYLVTQNKFFIQLEGNY